VADGEDLETLAVKGGLLEGLNWSGTIQIAVMPIPESVKRWDAEFKFDEG
jgi:hypothetical protein